MNKKYLFFLFLLLCGCSGNPHGLVIEDAESDIVCTLQENLGLLGDPLSFAMLSDGGFAVLTEDGKVYRYGRSGEQVKMIGSQGNAHGEYNRPTVVRSHGDSIYVWSSATMKFISYGLDGTPSAEYKYISALRDFLPSTDNFFIYTAGRQGDNIIDVYGKQDESVICSVSEADKEHKFLSSNVSTAPMCIGGDMLYYASKGSLDIHSYNMLTGASCKAATVDSKAFKVDELSDPDLMSNDRNAALKYLRENPFTLFLHPYDGGYCLLTLEGITTKTSSGTSMDSRHYGLYRINGDKCVPVACYSFRSIGTQHLFSSDGMDVYFIRHLLDGDNDVYTLNRLKI